jgi:hypothetical protein
MFRSLLLIAVPLLALSACGDSRNAATPAPPPTSTTAAVPRPPSPSDSLCPRDGQWRACHLEDRINKAGMGITVVDSVRVPFFDEPGVRYRIGRTARLVAFFLADSAAGVAGGRGLDPFRLTPRGDSLGAWPASPVEVVRSANLVAVLFEVSAAQAERVRLAITAGAPQPFVESAQQLPPAEAR